jgi:hypothetical protein
MPSKFPEIFTGFAAPFENVRERTQEWTDRRSGQRRVLVLKFITARQAEFRLDSVVGGENWWDTYRPFDKGSVLCRLSVRFPDDTIVTKQGIGYAASDDDGTTDAKAAESDALKRAAVKFGIGRYLYDWNKPPSQGATGRPPQADGARPAPPGDDPPPDREEEHAAPKAITARVMPTAGSSQIYYWVKDIGTYFGVDIVKQVQKIAVEAGWAREWKTWPQSTCDNVVRRVARFAKKLPSYNGELDWVNTTQQAAPAASTGDVEDLRDRVWEAICVLREREKPDDPQITQDAARGYAKYHSNGMITDLPTETRADVLKKCLSSINRELMGRPT